MDQQIWETHCDHTERAVVHLHAGEYDHALRELDTALQFADSPHCHWDRALVLFGLNRHNEAYKDLSYRWQLFAHGLDSRGWQLRHDLPQWRGQSLQGKRLVVAHEAGFGDTIQLLRYLPHVQGQIALHMPPELKRVAIQFSCLVDTIGESDYFATLFDLLTLLPRPAWDGAYIDVDMFDRIKWQDYEGAIGIAWSSTRNNNPARSIELEKFLELLPRGDWPIVSLQTHERETAQAHGVLTPVISDFADLAALISVLGTVISIDTAALHMAGAINHPSVFALLPHVPCWRWQNGNSWYPNIIQCRQTSPGDWSSAFAQL